MEIPHCLEMERNLLGCVLRQPEEVLSGFVSKHKCALDYFHDIRCKGVFKALLELSNAGKPIDVSTVSSHLKKGGVDDDYAEVQWLVGVEDSPPTHLNWSMYADDLMDYYIKRRLVALGRDAIDAASTEPVATQALDRIQREVLSIAQDQSQSGERNTKQLVQDYLDALNASLTDPDSMMGIKTGYSDFDNVIKGLRKSNIIILAARPSVGKTSLAMCIARHVVVDQGIPTGVFSLEMSADALIQRMIHVQSKITKDRWRDNVKEIAEAAGKIAKSPLFIDDRSGLSVQQITAAARRMKYQHKIELLIIDYLQLIRSTREKGSRNDEVTEISLGCKNLAKELEVPVLLLSQLSRSAERDARPPALRDLRDSGSIEQDADICAFLWKDPSNEVGDDDVVIPLKLSVDKNREGLSGVKIPMAFHRNITRFEEGLVYKQ